MPRKKVRSLKKQDISSSSYLLDLKSPAPLLLDGKFATNEERDRALKIWRDLHPEYVVEQRKQEKVYQEWLKKHYNKDS